MHHDEHKLTCMKELLIFETGATNSLDLLFHLEDRLFCQDINGEYLLLQSLDG